MRITFILNIFLIIWLPFTTNCSNANGDEKQIQKAVNEELRLHPEARLVDLYKFFFQDSFGPGHIINDKKSTLTYFQNELHISTDFDSILWQPVGYKNQNYRVNLKLVKDGTLTEEELFNAFFFTAGSFSVPSIEEWIKEWKTILKVIEKMNLKIKKYSEDKAILDDMLAEGKVLVHHSDVYRKLYHPHYRVVNKKQFDTLDLE